MLKAMCETPVLVSVKLAHTTELALHENITVNDAFRTAKGIRNIYLGYSFYITVATCSNVHGHLPKRRRVGRVASAIEKIPHVEVDRFSNASGAHGSNDDISINPSYYKPTSDRVDKMTEYDELNEKDNETLRNVPLKNVPLPANFRQHALAFWSYSSSSKTCRMDKKGVYTFQRIALIYSIAK